MGEAILLIVFLVVILAVGAFSLFGPPRRMLSGSAASSPSGRVPTTPSPGPAPPRFPTRSQPEFKIPRMRDFSPGCLLGLMLGALVWFALWAVVLVLALRFLQTPYSGGG